MNRDPEAPKSSLFLAFSASVSLSTTFGDPPRAFIYVLFLVIRSLLEPKICVNMDGFLVPVQRKCGSYRSDLLLEVENVLTAEGRVVICGEGGAGYAQAFFAVYLQPHAHNSQAPFIFNFP